MQVPLPLEPPPIQIVPYNAIMARTLTKARSPQGARLAELRQAAHLSQAALGRLIGEKQQNIAFWEQSDKPPRSDVLPKLARVLGVSVEQLLDVKSPIGRRNGPVGKVRKLFEDVSELPRRQQEKVVEFVSALVEQYKRQAS
jgi:transcriptional regulator with XRE-family HTH domain